MEKVVKKLIAEQLLHFCGINKKFYKRQIGAKKYWLTIGKMVLLIQKVQKAWESWKIAVILFMDVKKAFHHIFQAYLAQKISDLGINDNLMRWIKSFLSDR